MNRTSHTNELDLHVPAAVRDVLGLDADNVDFVQLVTKALRQNKVVEAAIQHRGGKVPVASISNVFDTRRSKLLTQNYSEYGYPAKKHFTLVELPNIYYQLALGKKGEALPSIWDWILRWLLTRINAPQLNHQAMLCGADIYPIVRALNQRTDAFNQSLTRLMGNKLRFCLPARLSYFFAVQGTHAEVVGLTKKLCKHLYQFEATEYVSYVYQGTDFCCVDDAGNLRYALPRGGTNNLLWDERYMEAVANDVLAWSRARKLALLA